MHLRYASEAACTFGASRWGIRYGYGIVICTVWIFAIWLTLYGDCSRGLCDIWLVYDGDTHSKGVFHRLVPDPLCQRDYVPDSGLCTRCAMFFAEAIHPIACCALRKGTCTIFEIKNNITIKIKGKQYLCG